MLSKKIFISKLVPPQKLLSRAQAAPRAHGHGHGPPCPYRDPCLAPCPALPPWAPIAPPAGGRCHQWVPQLYRSRVGDAGGEVIPMEREPWQLFTIC